MCQDVAHTEGEFGDQRQHKTVLNVPIGLTCDFMCSLARMLTTKGQHFSTICEVSRPRCKDDEGEELIGQVDFC